MVHELPVSPENRSRVGGIPVTDVSRTTLDCCQTLEFRSAVVVMEAALFRELTSEPSLAVDYGVIAEFDGQVKYNDRSSIFSEKVREDRLRELGYEVVRITWSELMNHPEKVAQRIRAAMERADARWGRVAR